jgi:hypothetical protein
VKLLFVAAELNAVPTTKQYYHLLTKVWQPKNITTNREGLARTLSGDAFAFTDVERVYQKEIA